MLNDAANKIKTPLQAFKSFQVKKSSLGNRKLFWQPKSFIMSADFIQLFPISEVHKSLRDLQHKCQCKKL